MVDYFATSTAFSGSWQTYSPRAKREPLSRVNTLCRAVEPSKKRLDNLYLTLCTQRLVSSFNAASYEALPALFGEVLPPPARGRRGGLTGPISPPDEVRRTLLSRFLP